MGAKEGFDQIAAALDRVADGDPHKAAEILRSLPPEARDDQRVQKKLADAENQVADAQENKRKKDEHQKQQQQQRSLDDADQKAKDTAKKTADQLRDDANHPDTTPKAKE